MGISRPQVARAAFQPVYFLGKPPVPLVALMVAVSFAKNSQLCYLMHVMQLTPKGEFW
jgi:hypothetical protein